MIDKPSPELEEVRGIVEQIAQGLQSFHRQEMLHQDLKPENIILDDQGTLKIVDFGSVKVAGIAEIQTPVYQSNLLGTANYSAPENLADKSGSTASDIFSLGVITYEMLTAGQLPFGEIPSNRKRIDFKKLQYKPSSDFNDSIPDWIDGALRKAVSADPMGRYHELSEFLYDLRNPNDSLIREDRRPLLERQPLRFWRGLSGLLSLIILVLLISIFA